MKSFVICILLGLISCTRIYSQFEGGIYDGFNSIKLIITDADTNITRIKSSFYGDGLSLAKFKLNDADTVLNYLYSSFYGDGLSLAKFKLNDADTVLNYLYSSFYGDGSGKTVFNIPNSDTLMLDKSTSYVGDGHCRIMFDTLFHYGLNTPINLSASLIGKQQINLGWNEVEQALNYKLFRSDSADGPYKLIYYGSNLFYTDIGNHLNPATYYYFRVMAENFEQLSGYSDILQVKTLPEKHLIKLNTGWNMISTYIRLVNIDMEDVLLPIVNNIVIVKNNLGQIYFPEFGINDIGNWKYEEAYQIYTNRATTLEIEGAKSNPQIDEIALTAGWNMLAYLRDNSMDIEIALASLTQNGTLVIAKDNLGNVFFPAFEINMIGDMLPGQGYQIYLLSSTKFKYPGN